MGKYRPKRFFVATLCFENLSSGLNLAGCADSETAAAGVIFLSVYTRFPAVSKEYMRCICLINKGLEND